MKTFLKIVGIVVMLGVLAYEIYISVVLACIIKTIAGG